MENKKLRDPLQVAEDRLPSGFEGLVTEAETLRTQLLILDRRYKDGRITFPVYDVQYTDCLMQLSTVESQLMRVN